MEETELTLVNHFANNATGEVQDLDILIPRSNVFSCNKDLEVLIRLVGSTLRGQGRIGIGDTVLDYGTIIELRHVCMNRRGDALFLLRDALDRQRMSLKRGKCAMRRS
jgi:hypothetical protein